MQRVSQPVARPFNLGRAGNLGQTGLVAVVILGAAGFAMLAAVASAQAQTALDVRIAGWVQAVELPGLGLGSGLINVLTSAPMAIALWLAAMTFFVLKGRPVEAIAVFLISGLWVANQMVGVVVDRPVPTLESGGTVEFARTDSGSFPSGHVTGAVAFYGLLTFLAFSNLGEAASWWPFR